MIFDEFTLVYEGRLKANGNSNEKHNIRKVFHKQLRELNEKVPSVQNHIQQFNAQTSSKIGSFNFIPIFSLDLGFTVNLDITLLRPEARGQQNIQSGDTDNRLKTLYDALKVPSNLSELPSGVIPESHENPFFCLLADDCQIVNFRVSLKQGFIHNISPIHTLMTIDVKIVNSSISFSI
ncbi:MAG: hypothetical protein IAE93_10825 [Ignavibacteria bacterium]|nr:hypothetical protein [Ignavibacteria bacterium]